ncbi:hypothetical protein AR687_20495 [Flavobacteriaceae bacterium CRH]|nr:hypothetical protein AR687_20495 [Flavobacteriaceae bacterium CRH]
MKNSTALFLIMIILVSCKKEINTSISNKVQSNQINEKLTIQSDDTLILKSDLKFQENVFSGDSTLGSERYFDNLTDDKGYLVLKKQNDLYQKKYSNFKNSKFPQIISTDRAKLKFEKQFINETKYRIVLYTFIDNRKKDSIEFYRNVEDLKYEPSHYTSLSYLDIKNKKIWKIKYFSSPVDKSVGYILYERSKIIENGKIETDSLYYLDESLDVEMEKNKLYY